MIMSYVVLVKAHAEITEVINEIIFLENTCKKIQQNLPNMWFVGVINHFNHLVAGGFSNDVSSYLSSDRELMMYGVCFGIECEERF